MKKIKVTSKNLDEVIRKIKEEMKEERKKHSPPEKYTFYIIRDTLTKIFIKRYYAGKN